MNIYRIDQKATLEVFKLLGVKVIYQNAQGQQKNCRAIIVIGAKHAPDAFYSMVTDRRTDISLLVKDVGRPRQGEFIYTKDEQYQIDRIIEDDGVVVTVSML